VRFRFRFVSIRHLEKFGDAMKRPKKSPAPRSKRLFAEPEHSTRPAEGAYTAHIDGAARGNPGPASYGVAILKPDGEPLDRLKKYVGRTTNNVAEYFALIAALDYAAAHSIKKLRIRSDSELLVRQMQGRYKVKSEDLKPLHERAKKLAASLEYFDIQHVPRQRNREADGLANEALDGLGAPRQDFFSGKLLTEDDLKKEQEAARGLRRMRARYRNGALYPAENLDLRDGTEVEITVSVPKSN
jgi:ribonuclease HI